MKRTLLALCAALSLSTGMLFGAANAPILAIGEAAAEAKVAAQPGFMARAWGNLKTNTVGLPLHMGAQAWAFALSKTPGIRAVFGDKTAHFLSAASIIAMAAFCPSTLGYYIPQVVSAISCLTTTYFTIEMLEWLVKSYINYPKLALVTTVMLGIIIACAYVDQFGITSKAKELVEQYVDKIPATYKAKAVEYGRNIASKLNLALDYVGKRLRLGKQLHINSAAEAEKEAARLATQLKVDVSPLKDQLIAVKDQFFAAGRTGLLYVGKGLNKLGEGFEWLGSKLPQA